MRFLSFSLLAHASLAAAAAAAVDSKHQPAAETKPSIVIVPGAWQKEPTWVDFRKVLTTAGYTVSHVVLPSVGLRTTGLDQDVEATQAVLNPLLEAGKDVVVIAHSLGGLVAANAVKDCSVAARHASGKPGGVVQLVYLAAFIAPKEKSLYDLMGGNWFDWMKAANGKVTVDPARIQSIGFNDLPGPQAAQYATYMTWTSEAVFKDPSKYAPWTDTQGVTQAYIHTTLDNALPLDAQMNMANNLPADAYTASIASSHVPFISKQKELLDRITEAAAAGMAAAAKVRAK